MEKFRKHTRQAGEITENWRQQYNKVRSQSSLGDRPPAPEAIFPLQVANA
jgi:hypothetical protein